MEIEIRIGFLLDVFMCWEGFLMDCYSKMYLGAELECFRMKNYSNKYFY